MAQQLTPYLREVINSEYDKIKTDKSLGIWKICALESTKEGMDSVNLLYKQVKECKNMKKSKMSRKELETMFADLSASGFISFVTDFKIKNTRPEITEMGYEILRLHNKTEGKHIHT